MMIEDHPPTDEEAARALEVFAAAVRAHYGERLKDIVLFGSRARGDHKPESDADVAVVISDGDWSFWREKMRLADLTYESLLESGLRIQPWPIAASEWDVPATHRNQRFVEAVKRDARHLPEAA